MRITRHEDGWIYGVFCAERHDDSQPGNLSAATATAAIARTKDLKTWERLPDLKSKSQQRNVVLHPEFVDGKYAFYTRPQDGFIDTGSGGGIGWALVDDITHAEVREEKIIYERIFGALNESTQHKDKEQFISIAINTINLKDLSRKIQILPLIILNFLME